MSKGKVTVTATCPDDINCGANIDIEVAWWDYPAYTPRGEYAPTEPPDSGWEINSMPKNCPNCNRLFTDADYELMENEVGDKIAKGEVPTDDPSDYYYEDE